MIGPGKTEHAFYMKSGMHLTENMDEYEKTHKCPEKIFVYKWHPELDDYRRVLVYSKSYYKKF